MTGIGIANRGRRLSLVAGCMAMVAACGGGGGSGGGGPPTGGVTPAPTPTATPAPAACSLRSRQDWALAQLNEWYLFPALLNTAANPASYGTVDDYIDALTAPARAQARDRYFTYLTSIAEENAFYEQGETAGFGIRLGYDSSANRVFVLESFETAPAHLAGIQRGAELLQINGQSVSALMASGGPGAVIQALGPDTVGLVRTIMYRTFAGSVATVNLTKTAFEIDPVANGNGARILNDGARRVGYLNLRTFIDTAEPDLRAAFADFKAQGVTELVIDFRYNGGGLLSIAALMIDLMGEGRAGQVNTYVTFRDSKASEGETVLFDPQPESIAPTKVAFIGTSGTASASEMVINGMMPFLGTNMALIGSNTYGKPVGQIALDRPECDDRLRALAFKLENADRQGEYFNGLASTVARTCRANDDISRPLGDEGEEMIRVALDFLAGRGCTPIGSATAGASVSTGRVGVAAERRLLSPAAPANTIERELPGAF